MARLVLQDRFVMDRWPEMRRFLEDNYRPGYIMANLALFRWQFCGRGECDHASVVCAWDGPRLVGILGYMPLDLFWGDTEGPVRGAWMANWMVAAEYRKGIGAIIMRRLMERFPVLLGQGANAANRPIASLLGFRIYPRIPRHVVIFSTVRTAAFLYADAPRLPAAWAGPSEVSPEVAFALPSGFDPDWRLYRGARFGTVRDAAYLRWRYLDHPMFEYTILTIGGARDPAICVFRLERARGPAQGAVGRIVEWFFPQTEDGKERGIAVLRAALAELRRRDAAFADFYASASHLSACAANAGMADATDLPLATRLNPVELMPRQQNLEVWTAPSTIAPPELGELYVTKSDGDQDRPN